MARMNVLVQYLDAIIPLGVAALILLKPQVLVQTDLSLEENAPAASKLRKGGYCLLGVGVAMLVINMMGR